VTSRHEADAALILAAPLLAEAVRAGDWAQARGMRRIRYGTPAATTFTHRPAPSTWWLAGLPWRIGADSRMG
jgi:hypothetical protein